MSNVMDLQVNAILCKLMIFLSSYLIIHLINFSQDFISISFEEMIVEDARSQLHDSAVTIISLPTFVEPSVNYCEQGLP